MPEIKTFDGGYLLFRRAKKGFTRKYAGNPRYRHRDRESAEIEAARLLEMFPDSTFVILREVGTVKTEDTANG